MEGRDGFKLVIAPDALTETTTITIDRFDAPDLDDVTEHSYLYEVRPMGLSLERTSSVYLPHTYTGDIGDLTVYGGQDPRDPDPGTGWHPTPQDLSEDPLIGGDIDILEYFIALVDE
jgi:hypothetical protein